LELTFVRRLSCGFLLQLGEKVVEKVVEEAAKSGEKQRETKSNEEKQRAPQAVARLDLDASLWGPQVQWSSSLELSFNAAQCSFNAV